MPKEKTNPDTTTIIQPVVVKTVSVAKQIDVPPGHSLVIPLKDGKEDEDNAFIIANRTAARVYENNPLFTVKKKN